MVFTVLYYSSFYAVYSDLFVAAQLQTNVKWGFDHDFNNYDFKQQT